MNESEPTTAASSGERPKRRRWKWWAASLLLLCGMIASISWSKPASVRRASRLKAGMTVAEVDQVMAPSCAVMHIPDDSGKLVEVVYTTNLEMILRWARLKVFEGASNDFPVTVRLDDSGKLAQVVIGRGFKTGADL